MKYENFVETVNEDAKTWMMKKKRELWEEREMRRAQRLMRESNDRR